MSQAAPAVSLGLGCLQAVNISTKCCQASTGVRSPNLSFPATGLTIGVAGARHSQNRGSCAARRADRSFGNLSRGLGWAPVKGRGSLRAQAGQADDEPPQQQRDAGGFVSESEQFPIETLSASTPPAEPSSVDTSPVSQLLSKLKALPQWQKTALLSITALPALPAVMAGFNLDGPTSVAQALIVLGAIVTFHECGHFLAARLQNIPVSQFVIGFGPTLAEWKGKEVDYKLKALPLGGYVAFPDEDPGTTFAQDDPRLLKNRPLHERALVISAGVIANAILAYAVLFAQVS